MNLQPATDSHIPGSDILARLCEKLARGSLGWVRRDSMQQAICAGMMNVCLLDGFVGGFVIWSKPTRGVNRGWHVVHTLAVDPDFRRSGIGRELLASVPAPVRLKCPQTVGRDDHPNPANAFYAACGMTLAGTDATKRGKLLNVWERT